MSIAVRCGPKRDDGERIAGSFMCNKKCHLWKRCCAELGIDPDYMENGRKKKTKNELIEEEINEILLSYNR